MCGIVVMNFYCYDYAILFFHTANRAMILLGTLHTRKVLAHIGVVRKMCHVYFDLTCLVINGMIIFDGLYSADLCSVIFI